MRPDPAAAACAKAKRQQVAQPPELNSESKQREGCAVDGLD
jgi:hypothetical protein